MIVLSGQLLASRYGLSLCIHSNLNQPAKLCNISSMWLPATAHQCLGLRAKIIICTDYLAFLHQWGKKCLRRFMYKQELKMYLFISKNIFNVAGRLLVYSNLTSPAKLAHQKDEMCNAWHLQHRPTSSLARSTPCVQAYQDFGFVLTRWRLETGQQFATNARHVERHGHKKKNTINLLLNLFLKYLIVCVQIRWNPETIACFPC